MKPGLRNRDHVSLPCPYRLWSSSVAPRIGQELSAAQQLQLPCQPARHSLQRPSRRAGCARREVGAGFLRRVGFPTNAARSVANDTQLSRIQAWFCLLRPLRPGASRLVRLLHQAAS
ncbi:hypothetical protein Bcep1808_6014 [Burkholderia vietnamiensis G4]|uniref:Uncharacterized protein n=1 Tax=Burkholderia vietnamiensis (strain G4 / LMG 22486) TaxID=269482 RepID=A4JRN6_BURVG|nr:hypothetical protein Bcep1808_6014 [Burkholderia vietnamiensis G4]